jgi:hypothetical protein
MSCSGRSVDSGHYDPVPRRAKAMVAGVGLDAIAPGSARRNMYANECEDREVFDVVSICIRCGNCSPLVGLRCDSGRPGAA